MSRHSRYGRAFRTLGVTAAIMTVILIAVSCYAVASHEAIYAVGTTLTACLMLVCGAVAFSRAAAIRAANISAPITFADDAPDDIKVWRPRQPGDPTQP